MKILTALNYEIYRLRESNPENEFLIFNTKSKNYYQFSKNRAIDILYKEILNSEFDLLTFLDDINKKRSLHVKPKDFIKDSFEEEYKILDNLNYLPDDKRTFIEQGKEYFNIYESSELVKNYKSFEVDENSFPYIKKLLFNLCGKEEKEYIWVLSWLAWIVQNPLKRLPTALIFQGDQGTGKNTFCSCVLKPIFEKNYIEIGQTEMSSDFNGYMLGKQIIIANEVIHHESKFSVPDKLKNYVTDEFITINNKHKPIITINNYSQWIFLSNNHQPIRIDIGDRRYSVCKSSKLEEENFFINFRKSVKEELNNFYNYLMNLDVNFDFVSSPIDNSTKRNIQNMSMNSLDSFLSYVDDLGGFEELNNNYIEESKEIGNDSYNNILNEIKKEDGVWIEPKPLYILYTRFCKDAGYTHPIARNTFNNLLKSKFNSPDKPIWHLNRSIRAIRVSEVCK